MLHKCDEDYEALNPNFEEIDDLFPGMRQTIEEYDPWDPNREDQELLMPYLFHLHTHSEVIGLRILNPQEIMIDVDAGNFIKGLPKATAESIYKKNNDSTIWQHLPNKKRTHACPERRRPQFHKIS
eukprot:47947-Heterocapsa_arctica.AAC.1